MKRTLIPLPAPLISAALLEPSRFLTRPQLLTCLVPLPVGRDISPGHHPYNTAR